MGPTVSVETGLRLSRSSITGTVEIEPRVSLLIRGGETSRWRAAYGTHSQSPGIEKLLQSAGRIVILTTVKSSKTFAGDVEIVQLAANSNQVDLTQALQWLAAEQQVNELHVEAGSVLCGALLQAGLVDEVIIYMAPHLMGDSAKGLFHLPQIASMQQRIGLDITDIRAVGTDWRIIARPK